MPVKGPCPVNRPILWTLVVVIGVIASHNHCGGYRALMCEKGCVFISTWFVSCGLKQQVPCCYWHNKTLFCICLLYISSDISNLPEMTDEYIDLSVYALTGWLLYILTSTRFVTFKVIVPPRFRLPRD